MLNRLGRLETADEPRAHPRDRETNPLELGAADAKPATSGDDVAQVDEPAGHEAFFRWLFIVAF